MVDKSELVVISRVQGQATADIIKSHLESEGIPVLLKYESSGAIYGILVDGVGEIRILVPKEFADEARQIIEPQQTEEEED
jgi:Putative prokaryotic signal transducing protein